MGVQHMPVTVVLAPAAGILSGGAGLPKGVVTRNESVLGVKLFMIPVRGSVQTTSGTGSHLLKAVAGRDLKGMFKSGHGLSPERSIGT